MPYINIKLHKGRDQEQLDKLVLMVGDAAMEAIGTKNGKGFTIAIEEVDKDIWEDTVVKNEIEGNPHVVVRGQERADWLK
ncbi:4-oxalocrotonate tautomerase family protein [Eubacteriales bacterium OttesenSCG-928-M02]|nr:4-oxalocrotonate tautomerase family protein [Eubacteriales bacterium OttesenSCG-928-M02]